MQDYLNSRLFCICEPPAGESIHIERLKIKSPHLKVQLWLDDDWAHWDRPEEP